LQQGVCLYNVPMKKHFPLGELSPQEFLRDYWHKKPLLIRQAFPAFDPPVKRDQLFSLAARDDAESRLISHFRQQWKMCSGPFEDLPATKKKGWTLLVQGVNLHDVDADALMQQFRFIPDARLDDLMISYATDTGGVGPHFDSYDVFLLQAQGQRRWRIGAQKDLTLVDGMPLKILRNFHAEQEFILEPGDMLYLPPHYAHDGIAIGECMTYSIGFRAPSFQELGEAFLQFMADSIELPGRYADADLEFSRRPAEINRSMLSRVGSALRNIRFNDEDIAIFLGEYLSEPKPNVFFDAPPHSLTIARFMQAARKRGIKLSSRTRMLYRGAHVFINGESFSVSRADKTLLAQLADTRRLDSEGIQRASADLLDALYLWHEDGWLALC
jgi:50S ribosomal protein L16 3-hydroxylase